MDEPVGTPQAFDQFLSCSRPQGLVNLLLRSRKDVRKHVDFGGIAETSQLLQRRLRFDRHAVQLSYHQFDDVISVSCRVNSVDVPGPPRSLMIKCEHSLRSER